MLLFWQYEDMEYLYLCKFCPSEMTEWIWMNKLSLHGWGQQIALCGYVIFVPVLEVVDLLHHDPLEYSDYSVKWAFSQTNRRLWFPSVAANSCIFLLYSPFSFWFSCTSAACSVFCQIQRVVAEITEEKVLHLYLCNAKATEPVKIHVAIKPTVGLLKDGRDSRAHVSGFLHMILQQVGCLTSAVVDFEDHGQTKVERLLMSPLLCLTWRTETEWPAFLTKAFVLVLSKCLQYVSHALTLSTKVNYICCH